MDKSQIAPVPDNDIVPPVKLAEDILAGPGR